jgi:Lon protease-like protein
MKLSFLPGNLHLTKEQDGTYLVTMQGQELLRTREEKKAIAKFNAVRKDLEFQFPSRELTQEEKRSALENLLLDYKSAQVRASTKPPKKERITGTRTFG